MKILFDCTGFGYFAVADVMARPLGGTEHCLCYLIPGLRNLGHVVDYVCRDDLRWEEGIVDVVIHVSHIDQRLYDVPAKHVYFSHHPLLLDSSNRLRGMDALVCLSSWHRERYTSLLEAEGIRDKPVCVIGYGYDSRYFPPEELGGSYDLRLLGGGLIYHSFPNRGLSFLLDWAPDILEIDERLRIHVCSGREIYWREQVGLGEDLDKHSSWHLDRVRYFGAVSFSVLTHVLRSSFLHVYPCSKVDESFCMAVWMSQAVGLPVITTNYGALPETAAGQWIVPVGEGGIAEVKEAFCAAIEAFVKSPALWLEYAMRGKKHVLGNEWGIVVSRWEDLLAEVVYG